MQSLSLDIYKKTEQGVCGDWYTVIWGTKQECLQIAKEEYQDYLWTWAATLDNQTEEV
jgi:hypothetical protein